MHVSRRILVCRFTHFGLYLVHIEIYLKGLIIVNRGSSKILINQMVLNLVNVNCRAG
jgi:hypothetical protein